MINLLIIEDSDEMREYFKVILLKEFSLNISEASTLSQGLELIKKVKPIIILLDLSLPDGNGETICKEIRNNTDLYGMPFIIAITANTSQESINKNLELGCDDYIKKPFNQDEFLIRIKKLITRVPQYKEFIQYENIQIFPKNKLVIFNSKTVKLSKNEFELLYYFLRNKGLLLSRNNILDSVWKDNFEITDKAVDQCLKRLRKKMPILNEILISKRGFGYILK